MKSLLDGVCDSLGYALMEVPRIEKAGQRNAMTMATLVAMGLNTERVVELQWVEEGYPQRLAKPIRYALAEGCTSYFGSFQRWSDDTTVYVEVEPEGIPGDNFVELVQDVGRSFLTLPAQPLAQDRPVHDLLLAVPRTDSILVTVRVRDGKVTPVWEGKGAGDLNFPRLAPNGIYAARGSELVFFSRPRYSREVSRSPDDGLSIIALLGGIRYLSRFNAQRGMIVATTDDGVAHVIDVFNNRVILSVKTEALFVGTPGGEALPILLEIEEYETQTNLIVSPRHTEGLVDLAEHACPGHRHHRHAAALAQAQV